MLDDPLSPRLHHLNLLRGQRTWPLYYRGLYKLINSRD